MAHLGKPPLCFQRQTMRQSSRPLITHVMHTSVVAHQTFALKILTWLQTVIKHSGEHPHLSPPCHSPLMHADLVSSFPSQMVFGSFSVNYCLLKKTAHLLSSAWCWLTLSSGKVCGSIPLPFPFHSISPLSSFPAARILSHQLFMAG